MPDFRVFCRPSSPDAPELALSPAESHHLVTVNRARVGDPVMAFDGLGREWVTELVTARKAAAVLAVRSVRNHRPLPHRITLAQALPKGHGMDAIVRKATEIGAARVVPLASERTQVHLDDERSDRKVEKWQTAALEAAKQCGNPFLPEVLPVRSVAAFLPSSQNFDLKLIASLHPGAGPLQPVLARYRAQHSRSPSTVAWMIGPEGDFTPDEVAAATAAGFEPITLGPLVLRCETSAIYALSVLSYELGYEPRAAGR
jgi:16S rRNA (uracil1498-N3)-methyltransferase